MNPHDSTPHWTWTAPHWAVVILMGLLIPLLTARTEKPGEFYPFSNYPMYDSFEPATYYVYVTDGADKPIGMGMTFGVAGSDVKKAFDRKLTEAKTAAKSKVKKADLPLEMQVAAGVGVLEWLKSITQPSQQPVIKAAGKLRLHRVDITFKKGELSKTTRAVGEVMVP
jgi:hypothetical protein